MSALDPEAVAQFLARQRWFAGKGRSWTVTGSQTVGVLRDEPQLRVDLVRVRYDDGAAELYQLPVVVHREPHDNLAHVLIARTDDGFVYDALHDRDATPLWLAAVAKETRIDGLAFRRDPSAPDWPLDERPLVLGAEQSNTSVVFGHSSIFKMFRRVSPGTNPDIEVHAALAGAGCRAIAPPLGWVEGSWRDEDGGVVTGSLGMLQAFLHNGTEGWDLARTSVRDLLAEADLHADEVGGDFASEAARLGAATAEVHAALRAALPTASLQASDLRALADGMRGRLDAAAVEVPAVAEHREALQRTFDAVAALAPGIPVQRIHGDLHLGQTMRTVEGWVLLDFEGEPAKTLEERRRPDSALRDVAGMLRSFDYAARFPLVEGPADFLDQQKEYRAAEWAARNRDAFCRGYARVAGSDPRGDETDAALLRAYEADKAVYEVVYETRMRPSWVRIPLSALHRLAHGGDPAGDDAGDDAGHSGDRDDSTSADRPGGRP